MGPAGDDVQRNKVNEPQHHRGGAIMEENIESYAGCQLPHDKKNKNHEKDPQNWQALKMGKVTSLVVNTHTAQ